jgi:hypothetical protein
MFNIKTKIKELARTAVVVAEEELLSGTQKKALAIEFVVSNIPVASVFKKFIAKVLANFIDDAIELALKQMKSFTEA